MPWRPWRSTAGFEIETPAPAADQPRAISALLAVLYSPSLFFLDARIISVSLLTYFWSICGGLFRVGIGVFEAPLGILNSAIGVDEAEGWSHRNCRQGPWMFGHARKGDLEMLPNGIPLAHPCSSHLIRETRFCSDLHSGIRLHKSGWS